MSQLSKTIVFMIIFILVCGTTTFFAIKYVNDNKKENLDNNTNIEQTLPINIYESNLPDNSYLGLELGDKSWKNNIELIEQVETDVVYAKYYKISGLKNKEIENKINSEIKSVIKEEMQKAQYKENIFTTIYGNYSNVLSMCIYREDNYIYLNYDLTTGNKLKFNDLFINNCDDIILKQIKEIAKQNWVESYIEGTYDPETDTYIYDEFEYENYLSEIVNEYMDNKENISFSFTENSIAVNINDSYIYMNMRYIYPYVSIFKKYLTDESIFEKGNLKEDYCLMEYPELLYFEEYNDNLFLNIYLVAYNYSNDNIDSIVKQHYLNYIENKVDLLKQNSNEDSNTAKFLHMQITIYTFEEYDDKYTGLSRVYFTEHEYTMPKSEYVNGFRQKMFETNLFNWYNPLIQEYNKEKVSYNNISKTMYIYVDSYGEILELSLKDVFVEEYDYVAVVKEKLKQKFEYMQSDEDEKEYMENTYGKDIFEKLLSDLEKIQNIDFKFKLGDFEYEYYLGFNTLEGRYIYISDVFDMNKMK